MGYESFRVADRAQTEQQKEMFPGSQRFLSEYFQSCDRKQSYDKATDELLRSNLLFRSSWQAGDKYHGNSQNIVVIRRISW